MENPPFEIWHLKMYFLWNIGIFQCHVSFQGCTFLACSPDFVKHTSLASGILAVWFFSERFLWACEPMADIIWKLWSLDECMNQGTNGTNEWTKGWTDKLMNEDERMVCFFQFFFVTAKKKVQPRNNDAPFLWNQCMVYLPTLRLSSFASSLPRSCSQFWEAGWIIYRQHAVATNLFGFHTPISCQPTIDWKSIN